MEMHNACTISQHLRYIQILSSFSPAIEIFQHEYQQTVMTYDRQTLQKERDVSGNLLLTSDNNNVKIAKMFYFEWW